MPVYLSEKERKLVSKYLKSKRPTYHLAAAGTDVQISEDMEKFIILTPPANRNDIVSWINDSNKKEQDKEDRETLLGEALDAELADANAKYDESNSALKNYDKFRDAYFTNIFPDENSDGPDGSTLKTKRDRFGDVPEVGQALSDVSTGVDDFLIVRDRAKHQQVLATVLNKRLSQDRISKEQKLQIDSWAGPFTAYTNDKT